MTKVHGVNVYSWNPGRIRIPFLGTRFGPRLNNFGDLLGPDVISGILDNTPVLSRSAKAADENGTTLFAVGSILHFAKPSDVVWGAGINGKMNPDFAYPNPLDVRALRGPKTKEKLLAAGLDVGEVPFGDPGLLAPAHYGVARAEVATMRVGVVPNFNERNLYRRHEGFIDPLGSPASVVKHIAACEVVVGSSLHGQVIADALGIPCWPTSTSHEPPFKYEDYYLGMGVQPANPATSIEGAVRNALAFAKQEGPRISRWSPDRLVNSFPYDLWEAEQE